MLAAGRSAGGGYLIALRRQNSFSKGTTTQHTKDSEFDNQVSKS